jgi:twinkle protein
MTSEPFGIAGTAGGAAAQVAGATWAEKERRLSTATLAQLGVGFGMAFFPELARKSTAVFFRYGAGWKARAFPDKAHVCGKGFKAAFWNLDVVLAGPLDTVYLTEGELDACALVEAGIAANSVLSVPTGARAKPAETPPGSGEVSSIPALRGYGYVEEALQAGLSRAQRFVWCGDNDMPGHALRADIARLLGAARFAFVDWPEGCKDANDMLRTDGAQALHALVTEGWLPWPVAGLYLASQLPTPPPFTLWNPGFVQWGRRVLLAPRTLSVVTGQPGHGKTQLFQQIWFQIARAYNIRVCTASFETRPKPHLLRQYRQLFHQKPERELTDQERATVDRWVEDHYVFLLHPEQRPTLGWFLDTAEVAVVRFGAQVIQLDPWNRLEAMRAERETETEYIARCLRELYVFAQDMNCHVQVIAHPAKMGSERRNQPPSLEDISGSKHWENMVDQGFVVFRPELFAGRERKTECALFHRKARFEELGHPCRLEMNYQIDPGRYVSTDNDEGWPS